MKFLEVWVNTPLAAVIGWTLLHSLWQGAIASALLGAVLLRKRLYGTLGDAGPLTNVTQCWPHTDPNPSVSRTECPRQALLYLCGSDRTR
jgi:hypothetical protein